MTSTTKLSLMKVSKFSFVRHNHVLGCNKDPIPTEIPRIFIHTLLQPIIVTDYMDLVGILLFIFIILLFVFIWAMRESKKPKVTQRDIFFD